MVRPDLIPACGECAALCCVATSFEASEDFAFDKPAGARCRHLRRDDRCAIHHELVPRGLRGCALYQCYGAGQRATQAFARAPEDPRGRDEAFLVLRVIHELLWLLTEAARICPPAHEELSAELATQIDALDALARAATNRASAVGRETGLGAQEAATRRLLRRVGDAIGGRRRAARALAVVE
jgi:hypothetical protein